MLKLTKLKKLNIGYCKYSDGKLPPVIYKLDSLKELFMRDCGIASLDDE